MPAGDKLKYRSNIPKYSQYVFYPVDEKFRKILIPPAGSADNTTDWFFRGKELFRTPIKAGHIGG